MLHTISVLGYTLEDSTGSVGILDRQVRSHINDIHYFLDAGSAAYTPTYSWTGTGPSSTTAASWYRQLGKMVFVSLHAECGSASMEKASGTATDLTITLPVQCADLDVELPINAIGLDTGGNRVDLLAYIDSATGTAAERKIRFRNWKALHTANWAMDIFGWYESTV